MDVFDLYAKLSLDSKDYDRSLQQASSAAEKWQTKFAMAAKAVGSAFSASASVLTGVVKQSVTAFADYQQQFGGIETLFGAGGKSVEEYAESVGKSVGEVQAEYDQLMEAQNTVMENANNAWINQGLSANEYMEQVTSFSAALKQSTSNSTEAAQIADLAMTDMADNANKFGTDIASIQNAYQGFAKQNYTMLDNLKLGYGGTKEEMERLLAHAQELTGIEYNIDNLSDVYSAIHVVQEELGVVDTTAKEAQGTISGSAAAMKSAWENVLIAMGSGEGVDTAVNNLVQAFGTLSDNLIPVIQRAIESAAQVVEQLAPKIAEILPGMVEEVLPPLLSAVTSLVTAVAQLLGDPGVIDAIVQAGVTLFGSLLDNLPAILSALGNGVVDLVTGIGTSIKEHWPEMQKKFEELFGEIDLEEAGKGLVDSLKKGIDDKWQSFLGAIEGYVNDILNELPDWFKELFGIEGASVKLTKANFSKNLTDEEKLALGYSARPDQSLPTKSATETGKETTVNLSEKSLKELDDTSKASTTETVEATKDLMNGTERWLKEGEETNEKGLSSNRKGLSDLNTDMNDGFDTVTTGGSGSGVSTGPTAADEVKELYNKFYNTYDEYGNREYDWDLGTLLRDTLNSYRGNSDVYFEDMTDADWAALATMPAREGYQQGIYSTPTQSVAPGASTSLTAGTTTADGNLLSVAEGVSPDAIQSWLNLDAALQQVIDTLNGEGAEGGAGVGTEAEEGGLGAESIMDIAKNPISQDVIDSWKNLADAIQAVSNIINGVSGEGEGSEGGTATSTSTDAGIASGLAGAEGAAEGSLGSIMQIAQTPVSQEVIDSWNNLATAITGVVNAINGAAEGEGAVGEGAATASTGTASGTSGGSEGSEAEGGGSGLAGAFGSVKTVMEEIITVAQNLAAELGTNLPAAIGTLCSILCITSEDEEGNVSAGGGNTLYNSLGSVKGVLEDIYNASRNIAECWTGQLYSAADLLRQYAGDAYGQVQSLANAAQRAAEQYNAAADAVDRFAEAIQALANVDMPGLPTPSFSGGGARASGGPVSAGTTYLVGEVGPELFTPSRSGYIIPNDELGRGNGDSVINITFAGDVIGDEKSISAYVRRAVKAGIRQEVLIG